MAAYWAWVKVQTSHAATKTKASWSRQATGIWEKITGRTLQRRGEIRGRMLAMGRPGRPDLARSLRSERLATREGEGRFVRTHRRQAASDAGGSARQRRLQVGVRADTSSPHRLPRRNTSSGSCVGIPGGVGFGGGILRDGPGWVGKISEK
jgi:hypothetical protein